MKWILVSFRALYKCSLFGHEQPRDALCLSDKRYLEMLIVFGNEIMHGCFIFLIRHRHLANH